MRLNGLSPRRGGPLPGVAGVARVGRRFEALVGRLRHGEIAVLDQVDLDGRTAGALVKAGVAGVVNASLSISGRFPSLGPEMLLDAGITLIDGVGSSALRVIKNGSRLRLHDGGVFSGERELARGTQHTRESIADLVIEAKIGMSAQLEAFSANTIEFLRRERTLIWDGVGVPELHRPIRHRQVLVAAPGLGHAEELRSLRWYLAAHRPVLIGVASAADTLRALRHPPDVIVGDPDGISTVTLRSGAEIVIPTHLDGHAPGLERIQDLGVGAVTFTASGNAEDLALLLADTHGASLVVTVGFQATLGEFLDRERSDSTPSTFLTRLRLGSRLVDGTAVARLRPSRVPLATVLVLVLATLIAAAVTMAVSGAGEVWLAWAIDTWHGLVSWLGELFS
jgi:uncharacterized membrane-anchored protein